ncbi:MAG TPA: Asp-tRNA(Asn)/Glu-tRNA(Gln) amidotransferase subunit GatB [Thermoleophilia bacterium]
MSAWEPVIGLEMHVELDTRTKMFCACEVSKGDEPNTHTCPTCLAHPGALPVVNQRAVEYAARIALALNCTVRPRNIFHRKNYFYPDLPKAYQISQYDEPLAVDGWFEYWVGGEKLRSRINRVHMEEDAAKLVHAGGDAGRIAGSDFSMVDFNRGGTPLIEIVSEPDIPSPEAAREFLQQLRNLVVELGVSECNMEEGQIRWDANVSVRPEGDTELGTRTELKNMNSFRYLQQALDAEIPRQIEVIEAGGKIDLETLHFDPESGTTMPLRSKEEAHDYRYFPEPDLVPLVIDPAWVEELRATQPELPAARAERFASQYGLSRADALVLGGSHALAAFYEEVVAQGAGAKPAANWTMGEYLAHLNTAGLEAGHGHVTSERLAKLVRLVEDGTISTSSGKDVFTRMIAERAEPEEIVERHGLGQISDTSELAAIVAEVVATNPAQVEQYRAGKQQVLGFLVGRVMKSSGGRANPQLVNELLRKALDG